MSLAMPTRPLLATEPKQLTVITCPTETAAAAAAAVAGAAAATAAAATADVQQDAVFSGADAGGGSRDVNRCDSAEHDCAIMETAVDSAFTNCPLLALLQTPPTSTATASATTQTLPPGKVSLQETPHDISHHSMSSLAPPEQQDVITRGATDNKTISANSQVPAAAKKRPSRPVNVFRKLGLFFHVDGEKNSPDQEEYSDRLVPVDDYRLLPALLEDMLARELYTAQDLTRQLVQYSWGLGVTTTTHSRCTSSMEDDEATHSAKPCPAQLRQFVAALYTAAANRRWDKITTRCQLELEYMLTTTSGAFETLFHTVLSTPQRKAVGSNQRRRLQQGLTLLEEYLEQTGCRRGPSAALLTIPTLRGMMKGPFPSLSQMPMSLGEMPLMVACRHRNPEVVLLLLRHGVSGAASWMSYTSALEVLLFAPSRIQMEERDTADLELCLEYYLRGPDEVNVKLLEGKVLSNYHLMHRNWRALLPAWCTSEPRPLVHLSRISIRNSLFITGGLPRAIPDLPIPKLLRDYVDLRS